MIHQIVISTGVVTTLAGSTSNGRSDNNSININGTGTLAYFIILLVLLQLEQTYMYQVKTMT